MDLRVIILVAALVAQISAVCQDVNTAACEQFVITDPHTCEQEYIRTTVCPKFCENCPLKCYDCVDIDNCTTTKECKAGELCMRRASLESIDAAPTYVFSCAAPDTCDGSSSQTIIGRRQTSKGHVFVDCCAQDMCNTPPSTYVPTTTTEATSSTNQQSTTATSSPLTTQSAMTSALTSTLTTTTMSLPNTPSTTSVLSSTAHGCQRDITFLVQDSAHQSHGDLNDIKDFLKHVVHDPIIIHSHSRVGLHVFQKNIHHRWDLDEQKSTSDLLHAISNIHLSGDNDLLGYDDLLKFINQCAHDSVAGDRPLVKDVVVIIADTHAHVTHDEHAHSGLQFPGVDVIVVTVGHDTSNLASITSLATGQSHVLSISDYNRFNSINNDLLHLICS